jgi:hypothetical protein
LRRQLSQLTGNVGVRISIHLRIKRGDRLPSPKACIFRHRRHAL